ncbi:MAG: 1,4-dihydroxy-6-naphthoate synthase [Chitinophagaceae bacterium]
MKLSLGFSPCPNDTFIFDALVNKKIDTEGLDVDVHLEDVETLNQWTLQGRLDITKLSFPAFFQAAEHYGLLDAGSALGKGVGPLLISAQDASRYQEAAAVHQSSIALPGIHTTANLLFSFAWPQALNRQYMIFSAIEDAVLNGDAELGVIIHENRFTYAQKGLHKVMDLGEYWETKMKVPIPLGGIAAKRELGTEIASLVNRLIRKSLAYAFDHYPLITGYVKQHSQAMSEEVMRSHIDLYVNDYSLSLGAEGRNAVKTLHGIFLAARGTAGTVSGDDLFL